MNRPYFLLYVNDLLASPKVDRMDDQQFGWYMKMLCRAWHFEKPCHLPNDDEELMNLAKVANRRQWNAKKKLVLSCWKTTDCGKYIFNTRLLKEFNKLEEKYLRLAEAGRKGGLSNAKAMPKQPDSDSDSDSEPELKSESTSNDVPEDGIIAEIACAHPKNEAKKLSPNEVPQNQLIAVIEAVGGEAKRQGLTNQAAAEWVLAKTRHVAKIAKDAGKIEFVMAPVKFFHEKEYRNSESEVPETKMKSAAQVMKERNE